MSEPQAPLLSLLDREEPARLVERARARSGRGGRGALERAARRAMMSAHQAGAVTSSARTAGGSGARGGSAASGGESGSMSAWKGS